MEKTKTHRSLIDDEWYHVRHSGEIPEVALHSSLHYLTDDQDGPKLHLDEEDHTLLYNAAMERYREIIIRDITPENRDATIYRGILRTIANWRRLKRFCQRHNMSLDNIKLELSPLVETFLRNEIDEVDKKLRTSSINCTFKDIQSFAIEIELSLQVIEMGLRKICLDF